MTCITTELSRESARAIKGLLDKKLVAKARMKAANVGGAKMRKALGASLPDVFDAPKAAARIKGRAAHASQKDPAYRLTFAQAIAVSRLRARARKLERQRGKKFKRLRLRQPDGSISTFKAVRTEGKGRAQTIELVPAGPLPARGIGPIRLPRNVLRSKRFPALVKDREAAERAVIEGFGDAFNAILERRAARRR